MKDFGVKPIEEPLDHTSLTLLDRVRRKDKEAWERLVSLYTPLVYHWCIIAGLQAADAEETAQEVFLAVARAVVSFHRDQDGDTFRGWLRIITRNKIFDHAVPPGGGGQGGSAAQKRLQELPDTRPLDEATPESQALEKNILYNRAVELIECSFEAKTRRAFWLLIAGRKPKDVAKELDMSASAVYTAKSKILKRLREEFRGLVDQGPEFKTSE